MLTKTKIALAAALIAGTASLASAEEFDANLANRYPVYNGPAAQGTFQTAPVALTRNGQIRTAPVRLQNQGTFQEPASRGADHLPGAFQYQVQPGFPQSPPGGGY